MNFFKDLDSFVILFCDRIQFILLKYDNSLCLAKEILMLLHFRATKSEKVFNERIERWNSALIARMFKPNKEVNKAQIDWANLRYNTTCHLRI